MRHVRIQDGGVDVVDKQQIRFGFECFGLFEILVLEF